MTNFDLEIADYEIKYWASANASPPRILQQINLFNDRKEAIGYLKFIPEHEGTRENECCRSPLTVYYRENQFEMVLKLLNMAEMHKFVFCYTSDGDKGGGIRVKTKCES